MLDIDDLPEEARETAPHVLMLASGLITLAGVENALRMEGATGEALICRGLRLLAASIVATETAPSTVEHRAAAKIVAAIEEEDANRA
jgi:hypothetical protein